MQRVFDAGVELTLNSRVDDVLAAKAAGNFDAVFLAVGAHIGKRTYIPAGESAHVLDAIGMLREMEGEEKPLLGRRVVVYGGGNTAMDAARTAKRLGADEAIIVYRRTRDRMPANDLEVQEALEEGVLMRWLSTIKHVDADHITVERMELDDDGFPQPTGSRPSCAASSRATVTICHARRWATSSLSDRPPYSGAVNSGSRKEPSRFFHRLKMSRKATRARALSSM